MTTYSSSATLQGCAASTRCSLRGRGVCMPIPSPTRPNTGTHASCLCGRVDTCRVDTCIPIHAKHSCTQNTLRLAVEAVLPQLHTLDGAHTTHQHSSACVLQHIAATKLASIANVASVVHDEACVNETSQKADVGDGIQDHTQASQHVHAGGGIQTSGRIQSVLAACYPGRTAQHGVHVGSGHARRWCCDVAVQASAW